MEGIDGTVSIGTPGHMSAPIPFDEFKRRCENITSIDSETGEVLGRGVQPTLDDAIFKPMQLTTVRVNFSGGFDMKLEDLRAYADEEGLHPGRDVEVTLQGYICGAAIKWKRGEDSGRAGALNISLTDLLNLEVQATSYTTDEMEEGDAGDGE